MGSHFAYFSFFTLKADGPKAFIFLAVIVIPLLFVFSDTSKSPKCNGSMPGTSNSGIPFVKYGRRRSTLSIMH